MNSFANYIPAIIVALFILVVPLSSLIIWFRTKDSKNSYLKKLYIARFCFGIVCLVGFVVLDFIFDRYNLLGDPFNLGFVNENIGKSELVGYLIGRYGLIYLYMRKWVK